MLLFHSCSHIHTATAPVVPDDSSIFCFGIPVRAGAGRGRLQQPAPTKMSEQSPWHSVKSWAQHIHYTVHSLQTQSLCSLSFSPLNSPVCSAALTSPEEGPCPLQCPHQQCDSVLIQNQEDHGLLSLLFCVVLVFAASVMPLCIYVAIMCILAPFPSLT